MTDANMNDWKDYNIFLEMADMGELNYVWNL